MASQRKGRAFEAAGRLVVVAVLLAALPATAATKQAGVTVFARGVASAQSTDGATRILGRNAPVNEGDVISTGRRSYAVLKLDDGSRMTLRPNTAFKVESFVKTEKKESMFMRLFKGGLRMVTGFISKRNPDAARLQTRVATIGIRGTDFEARFCDADCREEAKHASAAARDVKTGTVVARVVYHRGRTRVKSAGGTTRNVWLGGGLYEGDTLETERNSVAVLSFRDKSRVTVQSNSGFKVERYRHDKAEPARSNSLMRLVRGGMRMLTGLIGRFRPSAVRVATPAATIGIRGTGFDLLCQGNCVSDASAAVPTRDLYSPLRRLLGGILRPAVAAAKSDGLMACAWQDTIEVLLMDGPFPAPKGECYMVANDSTKPTRLAMSKLPMDPNAIRPDSSKAVDPDLRQPFAGQAKSLELEGFFVLAYKGDLYAVGPDGRRIYFSGGESVFLSEGGAGGERLLDLPSIIQTPDPAPFEDILIQQRSELHDDPFQLPELTKFECTVQ